MTELSRSTDPSGEAAIQRSWRGPVAVFLGSLVILAAIVLRAPVIYDTDSYYHLAVARLYAQLGVVDTLPWARLSLLHEGFGDKEVLFHWLLSPFAGGNAGAISSVGGRWAIALLGATIATVVAVLGRRALGPVGLLAPVVVFLGSPAFLIRIIRLRPELLALVLFLLAAWCVGRGRFRTLGGVAFIFALSYTAFHALLGLCFLWFVQQAWAHRRWRWGVLLYPILGVGLALLVHPHFPHNLVVWKVQSIDYFQLKGSVDVGNEIDAGRTDTLLLKNLGLWAALLLLALGVHRSAERRSNDPLADAFAVAALAFGCLYLLMARFVTYAVPFVLVAAMFEVRRRGGLAPRIHLPWRGVVPRFVAVIAVGLLCVVPASGLLRGLLAPGPVSREAGWARFGAAVPAGAKIAATWGNTGTYVFWAPHATYLNVLDPIFMVVPFPETHAAQRAIFDGTAPDVPRSLVEHLDADHLALSILQAEPRLLERLAADPRLEQRVGGLDQLYRLAPAPANAFILDWRVAPRGSALPVPRATLVGTWPRYPRAEDPRVRAVEGFVDGDRVSLDAAATQCQAMIHDLEVTENEQRRYELALYGSGGLWLDDRQLAFTRGAAGAVLGQGLEIPVTLEPGSHRLTILTCRAAAGGPNGFYLVDRSALG